MKSSHRPLPDRTEQDDLLATAQVVAKDFGVPRLASRMGAPVHSLYNKLNPTDSHHKLSASDLLQITAITGDYRLIHAFAHTFNHVAFEAPAEIARTSDEALLDLVCKIAAHAGEWHASLRTALEDGEMSRGEFRELKREGLMWMAAIAETLARLEGITQTERDR